MEYRIKGLDSLIANIRKNPQVVKDEVGNFLTRATALYKRTINNNPWGMGKNGGGVPVAKKKGGTLRLSHQLARTPWSVRIFPTSRYAGYVHKGTRKMKARPWLDYAVEKNQKGVEQLEEKMLDNIVKNLAK